MTDSANFNFALWQLLLRTLSIMKKAREIELNELGTSSRNSAVLSTIMRLGEEATLSNIAEQLVLEVNTISTQLSRMEKDGLIEKSKDPKRKNLMTVRITDKGYESFIRAMKRNKTNAIMSALTEKEKHNLWTTIAKIRKKSMAELGKDSTIL